MGEFLMPSLGADMDTGTIVEWMVHPGDAVHRGDIVAVVDTEKSDIEVEVFEDGVVEELLVPVGQEVHVGTPLARIGTGAPAGAPAPAKAAKVARATQPREATKADGGHVRATPRARRLAVEQGVDLAGVAGTGPGGAVLGADLSTEAPAPVPAATQQPDRPSRAAEHLAAGRRATGELMARSKRDIPHYHVATTIDLAAPLEWLARRNEGRPPAERVLPAALLLRSTALAAAEVPALNGTWDGEHRPSTSVHLGVAISQRGGGLVAPAIRDAESLTLDDLMAALRELVERARAGRLRSSELSGASLTVTNLGDQGADEVLGVIYPPQVALVGFGRIVDRPWAVDGMLAVRPTVRATAAGDHRASDGHEASRFLTSLEHHLRDPGAL